MTKFSPAIFSLIIFAACWLGTGIILFLARRNALLAYPNERSSHSIPTPFGGGIAMILALVVVWYLIGRDVPQNVYPFDYVIWATGVVALMSFADDYRSLPINIRLAVQIFAIIFVLNVTPAPVTFFGGLLSPVWDNIAAGLIWLWFINLFNFMDGIDGIAGVETISLSGGIALVLLITGLSTAMFWLSLTIFAAAFGFLWWNWQPAKIFLGDVGSVPLGFFLGWLLLTFVAEGYWIIALILPLYYLADATITLLRRALRGEKIWRAHKEHFYQRAVQRGLSHSHVSCAVLICNVILIGCASLAAQGWTWLPLIGACIVTMLLLLYLAKRAPKAPGDTA